MKAFYLILLLLTGCKVGPQYESPTIEIPCEWNCQNDFQNGSADCFVWWQELNDPVLTCLIEQAEENNLDLYMAAERIRQVRFEQKGAGFSQLPHIDATATYGHLQYNRKLLNKVLGTNCSKGTKNIDFFEIGFDAEWEMDLFGRNERQMEILKARLETSIQDYYGIWITLSAEVARNYIQLRGLQHQLKVILKDIDSQEDTVQLTKGLIQAGFASTIDLSQTEEQLKMLQAQQPQIELAIQKIHHRLSILLGSSPGKLNIEEGPLPMIPCYKPIGIPSELLRRRPDIQKAEKELVIATEKVGLAIADLFPRFSLYGFVGEIGTFCGGGSPTWLVGPQLLAPIFNSKLLQQDVDITKSQVQESLYKYQKVIFEALEEAENSIAAFHAELERNKRLEEVQKISLQAYELTLQLYERGLKNYLEVVVAYRSYLTNRTAFIQSQVDLLEQYISLYKALGGAI